MLSVNIGFITGLGDWISKKLTNTREPEKEIECNITNVGETKNE